MFKGSGDPPESDREVPLHLVRQQRSHLRGWRNHYLFNLCVGSREKERSHSKEIKAVQDFNSS